MVRLLNTGEISQKREADFFCGNKVAEEMTQGTFMYKYIFLFFLTSQ